MDEGVKKWMKPARIELGLRRSSRTSFGVNSIKIVSSIDRNKKVQAAPIKKTTDRTTGYLRGPSSAPPALAGHSSQNRETL